MNDSTKTGAEPETKLTDVTDQSNPAPTPAEIAEGQVSKEPEPGAQGAGEPRVEGKIDLQEDIESLAMFDAECRTMTRAERHYGPRIEAKLLTNTAKLPTRGTPVSAGLDLYADIQEPITLLPGQSFMVPTGVAIHIDEPNLVGFILPRSGLGSKGLVMGNGTGVIDSDYQGELKACLVNRLPQIDSVEAHHMGNIHAARKNAITINPGDRIAQLLIVPVALAVLDVVDAFAAETERGEGGFGSTGAN